MTMYRSTLFEVVIMDKEAPKRRKGYFTDYKRDHYKRVPIDFKPEEYNEIKDAAENVGETVTAFIRSSVRMRIDKME